MPQPHSMINKRPGQETRGITFGFFPESYKFWDLVPRQLHLAHSALNTLLTLHTSPLCPTSCLLPVLFPLLRRPCSQPSACPHISSIMSQLTCDLFGGAALVNTLPSTPVSLQPIILFVLFTALTIIQIRFIYPFVSITPPSNLKWQVVGIVYGTQASIYLMSSYHTTKKFTRIITTSGRGPQGRVIITEFVKGD